MAGMSIENAARFAGEQALQEELRKVGQIAVNEAFELGESILRTHGNAEGSLAAETTLYTSPSVAIGKQRFYLSGQIDNSRRDVSQSLRSLSINVLPTGAIEPTENDPTSYSYSRRVYVDNYGEHPIDFNTADEKDYRGPKLGLPDHRLAAKVLITKIGELLAAPRYLKD